eukprot:11226988-Lingulodinium_polyedra.AAC.1
MAMGTVARLSARGVQPVSVSAGLSSNVSPRARAFVPVPSAGLPTHSQAFARVQWLIPVGVATAAISILCLM